MKFLNNTGLIQYLTLSNIAIYLLIINLIGFLAMGIDKFKAQKGYWRTPEGTLMIITMLGGGIGTIAGMYMFRHKTKKLKFTIGLPTILFAEVAIITYLLIKY